MDILVIDDDERLLFLIAKCLEIAGYSVKTANSAKQARLFLSHMKFDAIVVDWMMPEESGVEFVGSLKSPNSGYQHIPVMMLTALDSIDHKLKGFESGADDYLAKPFDERELIARLKVLAKRNNSAEKSILQFGECSFNIDTGELLKNSERVYLTSTEINLLRTLCQKPNSPFSREDLARKLGFIVNDRTVDVQITRLRKKIGDNSKTPAIIQTIRHIGYLIVID